MRIADRIFDTENEKYIFGILNVTPDSFSDGGDHHSVAQAVKFAEKMLSEGADVIDIGGESTRPGYTMISDEEEIGRVVPVVKEIRKEFPEAIISVDTYKSAVAKAALDAGAHLINDIWGLKYDVKMAEVIASYDAACCLMHNRKDTAYADFMSDVISDLEETLALAKTAGIRDDGIMLDPGVGFAKDYEQNLYVTNHVDEIVALGYPVLLGTSRKSMIGLTLNVPAKERVSGTVATTVLGAMRGCSFFRVHDVKENKEALVMLEKMLGC